MADINECTPNGGRGECEQMCTNTNGSYYCSCQTGYTLSGYRCNGNNEVVEECCQWISHEVTRIDHSKTVYINAITEQP